MAEDDEIQLEQGIEQGVEQTQPPVQQELEVTEKKEPRKRKKAVSTAETVEEPQVVQPEAQPEAEPVATQNVVESPTQKVAITDQPQFYNPIAELLADRDNPEARRVRKNLMRMYFKEISTLNSAAAVQDFIFQRYRLNVSILNEHKLIPDGNYYEQEGRDAIDAQIEKLRSEGRQISGLRTSKEMRAELENNVFQAQQDLRSVRKDSPIIDVADVYVERALRDFAGFALSSFRGSFTTTRGRAKTAKEIDDLINAEKMSAFLLPALALSAFAAPFSVPAVALSAVLAGTSVGFQATSEAYRQNYISEMLHRQPLEYRSEFLKGFVAGSIFDLVVTGGLYGAGFAIKSIRGVKNKSFSPDDFGGGKGSVFNAEFYEAFFKNSANDFVHQPLTPLPGFTVEKGGITQTEALGKIKKGIDENIKLIAPPQDIPSVSPKQATKELYVYGFNLDPTEIANPQIYGSLSDFSPKDIAAIFSNSMFFSKGGYPKSFEPILKDLGDTQAATFFVRSMALGKGEFFPDIPYGTLITNEDIAKIQNPEKARFAATQWNNAMLASKYNNYLESAKAKNINARDFTQFLMSEGEIFEKKVAMDPRIESLLEKMSKISKGLPLSEEAKLAALRKKFDGLDGSDFVNAIVDAHDKIEPLIRDMLGKGGFFVNELENYFELRIAPSKVYEIGVTEFFEDIRQHLDVDKLINAAARTKFYKSLYKRNAIVDSVDWMPEEKWKEFAANAGVTTREEYKNLNRVNIKFRENAHISSPIYFAKVMSVAGNSGFRKLISTYEKGGTFDIVAYKSLLSKFSDRQLKGAAAGLYKKGSGKMFAPLSLSGKRYSLDSDIPHSKLFFPKSGDSAYFLLTKYGNTNDFTKMTTDYVRGNQRRVARRLAFGTNDLGRAFDKILTSLEGSTGDKVEVSFMKAFLEGRMYPGAPEPFISDFSSLSATIGTTKRAAALAGKNAVALAVTSALAKANLAALFGDQVALTITETLRTNASMAAIPTMVMRSVRDFARVAASGKVKAKDMEKLKIFTEGLTRYSYTSAEKDLFARRVGEFAEKLTFVHRITAINQLISQSHWGNALYKMRSTEFDNLPQPIKMMFTKRDWRIIKDNDRAIFNVFSLKELPIVSGEALLENAVNSEETRVALKMIGMAASFEKSSVPSGDIVTNYMREKRSPKNPFNVSDSTVSTTAHAAFQYVSNNIFLFTSPLHQMMRYIVPSVHLAWSQGNGGKRLVGALLFTSIIIGALHEISKKVAKQEKINTEEMLKDPTFWMSAAGNGFHFGVNYDMFAQMAKTVAEGKTVQNAVGGKFSSPEIALMDHLLSTTKAAALPSRKPLSKKTRTTVAARRAINTVNPVNGALFWGMLSNILLDSLQSFIDAESVKIIKERRANPQRRVRKEKKKVQKI